MHQLDRMEDTLTQLSQALLGNDDDRISKKQILPLVQEMFSRLVAGEKINAIQTYRQLTDAGLMESKTAIDTLIDALMKQGHETSPPPAPITRAVKNHGRRSRGAGTNVG
jgi:hypothetical protein